MRVYKGKAVSEDEKDLEYKGMVEEFLEMSSLSKTAVRQYINSVIDLMEVKEKIAINKASSILYFISLKKIVDNMELKNSIQAANENKYSVEKGCIYLTKKIEEYEEVIEQDDLIERTDIVKNLFISYAKSYCEYVDKQFNLAMQYLIRVKKIEIPNEEDKAYVADLETKILKNDNKMKAISAELNDVWIKIPSDIQEQIMASETMQEIKAAAQDLIK